MTTALKYSGTVIQLLTSNSMYLRFENGIRGGLTQASKRFARSCQPEDEDYTEEKKKAIVYLDKVS